MAGGLAPEEQRALTQRLREDFSFFAKKCLFIRTKSGEIVPFRLNRAQRYLHDRLEKQRLQTGRVRGIIVKGRQLGASTYIQGRFYWRLWGGKGLRAFILTHEQAATDNLFVMTKRFHDYVPIEARPPTKAANAKELVFSDNDCSYAVATAGTKGIGRSATLQLFHGSEAAFWPNAETHVDGVLQAIADVDGTERIFESTANGIGNVFQRRYAAAQRGASDEEAIFIPWFWGEDYTRDCPSDWQCPGPWLDYGERHGLEWGQLYWAYVKNRDMATATGASPDDGPCWKFKQEYPATADEAFQTAGNSFIPSDVIAKARSEKVQGQGPLIIGIDPARGGGDKTGVVSRRGRRLGYELCELWDFNDTMVIAGHVASLIRKWRPDAVNIDVGGLGAGVYDRLAELGYREVNAVNFGSNPLGRGPTGDDLYENRRAEMWDTMRDWFNDPAGVQIPDDDALHADLAAPVWGSGATRHKSNNELVIEPKDKIRERLGFSPDLGDASALTFAVPIAPYRGDDEEFDPQGRSQSTGY